MNIKEVETLTGIIIQSSNYHISPWGRKRRFGHNISNLLLLRAETDIHHA